MKKIVALVLSLVMVLGLATTAFALPLWAHNGSTADCDVFEANYNTKLNPQATPVEVTFDPGQALTFKADGSVDKIGVIPHYTMEGSYSVELKVAISEFLKEKSGKYSFDATKFAAFVDSNPADAMFPFTAYSVEMTEAEAKAAVEAKMGGASVALTAQQLKATIPVEVVAWIEAFPFVEVASIPADATPAEVLSYVLVKAHDKTALQGATMVYGQTATDAYMILKLADAITYQTTAEAFVDWSNDCEAYKAPANAATVDYYTVANKTAMLTSTAVKYAEAAVTSDAKSALNALVGDEVVTLDAKVTVAATKHIWKASAWDAKKVVTEYTCTACGVVGTVVNSPVNAPAGAKIDRLPNGTLVAYTFPVVEAPVVDAETDKVESAETFDAGIAMYVGMSVMAAAGSAVVLKKKD